MSIEQRLYGRINKAESGCWEFTGALRNGYGAIKYKGKIWGTHRLSYKLANGLIPEKLLICHKCDNRKCINPEHLFLGSQKDNMSDCKDKGRLIIPIGQKFKKDDYPSNAGVSLERALVIKKQVLNRGEKSLIQISKELEIPYQYVRDISRGRILKNR